MRPFFFSRVRRSANDSHCKEASRSSGEEGTEARLVNIQKLLSEILQQAACSIRLGDDPSRRSTLIEYNSQHVMTVYSGRDHIEIWLKRNSLPINENRFLPSVWKGWYLAEARNQSDLEALKPILQQALQKSP